MRIEHIETFVYDFEKLLLTNFNSTSYQIQSNALIIRKLLLDPININTLNNFLQINKKLLLNNITSKFGFEKYYLPNVRVFIPHVEILPGVIIENYQGLDINFIQSEQQTGRANFIQPEITGGQVNMGQFMNAPFIIVNGTYITKKEIIEYCCYVLGSVHYGAKNLVYTKLETLENLSFEAAQGENIDCLFGFTVRYKTTEDELNQKDNAEFLLLLGKKHDFKSILILEICHYFITSPIVQEIYTKAKEYLIRKVYKYKNYNIDELFCLKDVVLLQEPPVVDISSNSISFNHTSKQDKNIIDECNRILAIEDKDEQDIGLIDLTINYPDNINILLTQAHIYKNRGENNKSRRYYENIIKKFPIFAEPHNNLGLLLEIEFKELDLAKTHFEIALNLNPNFADAHFSLANLLFANSIDIKLAKYHYEKVIELNPNKIEAYNNLGYLLMFHSNDPKVPKEYFEKALQINPNFAGAYLNLGVLFHLNFKDNNQAITYFEKAISINPNNENSHFNLGQILEIVFLDYKKAKEHYIEVIRINPNRIDVNFRLGFILESFFNEKEAALRCYESEIHNNPTHYIALNNYANLLCDIGEFEKGRHNYLISIEANSNYATSYYNLGNLLSGNFFHKYDEALIYLNKALEINPNHIGSLGRIAFLYYEKFDDHEKSIKIYNKILEINKRNKDAYLNLGIIEAKFGGDILKAKDYVENVLKIDGNYAPAHSLLGSLYYLYLDKPDDAKLHLELAIKIDPNLVSALNNLAIILTTDPRNYEKAKELYLHSLNIDPYNAETHYGFAFLLLKHFDQFENAKEHLERAIMLNTKYVEAYFNLAILLQTEFKDYQAAIENYQKGIDIDPNKENIHMNLSLLILQEFGDIEKAKVHYLKACELNPNNKNIELQAILFKQ